MHKETKDLQVISDIIIKKDDAKPLHLSDEDYEKIKPFRKMLQFYSIEEVLACYEKFRPFITDMLNCTHEQAVDMIVNQLKYLRWTALERLMTRTREMMDQAGLTQPQLTVPFHVGEKLMKGAAGEDNAEIQDLWIQTLVNAVNPNSGITIRQAVIEILRNIRPMEAKIMKTLYATPYDEIEDKRFLTTELPGSVTQMTALSGIPLAPLPDDIETALSNLAHHGCLTPETDPDGNPAFSIVTPTRLGSLFVESCMGQSNNDLGNNE